MEMILAYFVLLKVILVVVGIAIAYVGYTINKKLGIGIGALLLVLVSSASIKYNGANSASYATSNQQQVASKYDDVDTTPEVTHKLSFSEKMKAEDERSQKETKAVQDEIKEIK